MLQVCTITAPAYWASALVNGDYSGLRVDECQQVQAWRARELPRDASIVGCDHEPRFTKSFRMYGGDADCGDVLDYQYLTKG